MPEHSASFSTPNAISLAGEWQFRFDDDADWEQIAVPGCWEMLDGVPKDRAGPAWYRTRLAIPESYRGRRVWLRFGAVSYDCEVFVNGQSVGAHRGLWDAFTLEITGVAEAGADAELLVRVEKPASLRAGPDSARLPGRFPLRETLAGFLPYVWGQIFGGIWQNVELYATGAVVFEDVLLRGDADGRVQIEATLSAPADVKVELFDPAGNLLTAESAEMRGEASASQSSIVNRQSSIVAPQPWSPTSPALYTARLTIADNDERIVRFGLRTLDLDGTTMRLNGAPLYPRMALSWGWYPEAFHSNPGPERVRADFARLRSLGYNGVKLCLWFPPEYYFELADELGMLLWVELPMWIPQPTAQFREQTFREYQRLVGQARVHPSVILYTLGCELNRSVGADLLEPLYLLTKELAGDALVRDNSGSGEAYGGLLNEYADFYDYHFYSELQFLRDLLDTFSPRWRAEKPWVFGEFCDQDTFRAPTWTEDGRRKTEGKPQSAVSESSIVNRQSSIVNRQSSIQCGGLAATRP